MTNWLDILNELIWPSSILLLAIFFRKKLENIIDQVGLRIGRGDHFEVGAGGIKLGSPDPSLNNAEPEKKKELEENQPSDIYLAHRATRAPDLDSDGAKYFRIRVWLDADHPELLNDVKEVKYILHPTFKNPVRVITDRRTLFGLNTIGWGEFNLKGIVTFNDGSIKDLERYITLD